MFKYVWIIILVLVDVFGWAYSIHDIKFTIQDKEDDDNIIDIFVCLEGFTQFWIILHIVGVFITSLVFYVEAKLKGA